jgi:hypothetical protein
VNAAVHPLKRVCIFCGSSRGAKPAYIQAAEDVGREWVRREIGPLLERTARPQPLQEHKWLERDRP